MGIANSLGPTHHPEITRRAVMLSGGAAALGSTVLAGCDFLDTEPSSDNDDVDRATKGGEAPSLAAQVDAGDLPPVEERLPENPLVVEPNDQIGVYGGTWNTVILGPADWPWLSRTVGYEGLMRWSIDWSDVIPNVAESVEQSEDGREFAVTLRKGLRWSDGELFTADDVIFAVEDVHGNEELSPVLSSVLQSQGDPMTIEKDDDYHFRFVFPEPNGLFFFQGLAMKQGRQDLFCPYPRHYFEQFHKKYNPDADELARDEGFADWTELFGSKTTFWENPDVPLLHPWIARSGFGEGQTFVLERNPYYWKVDHDGSQLPYLDQVSFEIIADDEVILLQALNGNYNFHTRHIMNPTNRPMLSNGQEDGGYELITLRNTLMNELLITLNLTHKDSELREVFQDKEFRIALSHAINREEMVDAVFHRQGEPWQVAPTADSEYFDEEFARQYTEYDPDLANRLLDEAGYAERDSSGFRLRPDGERISFDISVPLGNYPWHVEGTELVVDYWTDIGIDCRLDAIDRGLLGTRLSANDHDANVFVGAGGFGEEILEPRYYFPFSGNSHYAIPWAAWYTSYGTGGEEPPDAPRRQMELYRQITMTPDAEQRAELFREILAIAKEQFYVIGTVVLPETFAIVGNDFHNVPDPMIESDRYNTPGPTNPEQYFIA